MLKKIIGLIIIGAILYAGLFLLKRCNSTGGGNSPLALQETSS